MLVGIIVRMGHCYHSAFEYYFMFIISCTKMTFYAFRHVDVRKPRVGINLNRTHMTDDTDECVMCICDVCDSDVCYALLIETSFWE